MYAYGPPHMTGQKQDDQHEHTFSSYVRIRDVALKTCQRWWTIGKSGEWGSGISMLAARHDDDDDDDDKKNCIQNKWIPREAKNDIKQINVSENIYVKGNKFNKLSLCWTTIISWVIWIRICQRLQKYLRATGKNKLTMNLTKLLLTFT